MSFRETELVHLRETCQPTPSEFDSPTSRSIEGQGGTTYLVLGTEKQPVAHAGAMRKRINIQIPRLHRLGKVQDGERVVRLRPQVEISLLVHVRQQVLEVILARQAELVHGSQQADERAAEVLADERPAEDPGEEVPRRQVVLEGLRLVGARRRGDVELDAA